MSTFPRSAKTVVIGCGIVGNSLAYHLTQQGWTDVVLIDKGPLPNPGGSTGHASNFIYPVDHSKEMTALTLESVRQYREMGVFTQSGGIEVARPGICAGVCCCRTCWLPPCWHGGHMATAWNWPAIIAVKPSKRYPG